jgi:GT2 family glycosyltransferase
MRLNDATPADWDRVRKQHPAIEKKIGLEAWMKAAHDEDSELWEEDAGQVDWEDESLEDIIARQDEEEEDMVGAPKHYNTGNIECIDAIEESMSSVAFKGYLKGNCMKYLWRYDYKGKQVEDLQKAGWYLQKLTAMVAEENS